MDSKRTLLLLLALITFGCEPQGQSVNKTSKIGTIFKSQNSCDAYAPDSIDIMPLTSFVFSENEEPTKINIFVSLIDSYGSQVKAPGIFRFELFERVLRTGKPKGRRLALWRDIDLTSPQDNNAYWRDFLRAYEFNVDYEPDADKHYILQVTCMCLDGKRLVGEFVLR